MEAVHATGARSFLPVPGIAHNGPSQCLTRSPPSPRSRTGPPAAGESGEHSCGHGLIDRATARFLRPHPLRTTAPFRTTALVPFDTGCATRLRTPN